jgi:hypothetical protein
MTKGPFGLTRRLVNLKIEVSEDPINVELKTRGPMGFSRPFVSSSSNVAEERVDKCMESRGAHAFARGLSDNATTVRDDQVEEATRSWCRGILEATKEPTLDPAEVLPDEYIPPEAIEFIPSELEDGDD